MPSKKKPTRQQGYALVEFSGLDRLGGAGLILPVSRVPCVGEEVQLEEHDLPQRVSVVTHRPYFHVATEPLPEHWVDAVVLLDPVEEKPVQRRLVY